MKKITTILALFSVSLAFAQWSPILPGATTPIFRTSNVGIGTSAGPTANKLEVVGTSLFTGTVTINSGNPAISGLRLQNYAPLLPAYANGFPVTTSKVLTLGSQGKIILSDAGSIYHSSGYLFSNREIALSGYTFNITTTPRPVDDLPGEGVIGKSIFFINPTTENVGIGSICPDAKLAVNGVIHAKEVRVDLTGWCDYVFEEDYKLPTLEEVEKQIKLNGHLPNVPAACEMETTGLMVSQMAKIQQEKIEELTLYLIQQNKINEAQSKEIEELKAMVQALIAKQ